MGEDRSFAARWSARKQAVKDAEAAPEETVAPAPAAAPEPEKTEAEILAELNLKDPDEMEAGDDFSAFMTAAIPQSLRNRALRKLWKTNPALASLDGLLDYGDDFTGKGEIVTKLQTAYQVGKGFLEKAGQEAPLPGDSPVTAEEADDGADENPALNMSPAEDAVTAFEVAQAQPAAEPVRTPRKRMNFRFQGNSD